MDTPTKRIYGARLLVDDIECPPIVGPIVCALIAKLMEAEHHPDIDMFIRMYQGVWLHNLNPLLAIGDEGVLRYVKSEFSYLASEDAPNFLEHPICRSLLDGLKHIEYRERAVISIKQIDELSAKFVTKMSQSSSPPELESVDDLMSAMYDGGLSEGLIQSVMLRLPEEAYV
jgi:hypothetical protein